MLAQSIAAHQKKFKSNRPKSEITISTKRWTDKKKSEIKIFEVEMPIKHTIVQVRPIHIYQKGLLNHVILSSLTITSHLRPGRMVPLICRTILANSQYKQPMLFLPLLFAGIPISTYRIGESVSQKAMVGIFPKADSLIGCSKLNAKSN